MKSYLLLILSLFTYSFSNAQLSGIVTDQNGDPLSFANIYVKGTSNGTSSNDAGIYSLNLAPGKYEIIYQFIGYTQINEFIEIGTEEIIKNVTLEEESVSFDSIVVFANAEDPAYAIIRKAIAKRKYYKDLVDKYEVDAYIKGIQKFLDAPEKMLGQEIGNMGGILDSSRQGIVYLSESISKLYVDKPEQEKEIMISSKVSGNDNGFSWNSAREMNFDAYKSTYDFVRKIVSPINASAMAYYDYELEGTTLDKYGNLINKIKILPKRADDPIFSGYIYIVEDLWNVESVNLYVSSKAMQMPVIDSINIRQQYVPLEKPDVWMMLSQTVSFNLGVFGFKLGGTFAAVYTNYKLNPTFEKKFFGAEVMRFEKGANDKEISYWDSIRPIPLTMEEEIDYVKKDSLSKVWKSKPYLDSIDRKNNKFSPIKLLTGYTYSRSFKNEYFTFDAPISTIQFNTVQGFNLDLKAFYSKELDEESRSYLYAWPKINYSFSEKKLRPSLRIRHYKRGFHRTTYDLSGGLEAAAFNPGAVSKLYNTSASLFDKINYLKLYDKQFVKAQFGRDLFNGFRFMIGAEWSNRQALVNNTDYSWARKSETVFTSNNPRFPTFYSPSFQDHQNLEIVVEMRYKIGQKYRTYPDRKYSMGSKWPSLTLTYKKGIKALGGDLDYDKIQFKFQDNLGLKRLGTSRLNVTLGAFLNDNEVEFMDYFHFLGNQFRVVDPENYGKGFLTLPYFDYSNTDQYLEAHLQHNFEGFILDKIPLLKKLQFETIFGVNYLKTQNQGDFMELSLGIDKIGFHIFRFLRVDYVASFQNGKFFDDGIKLGISMPLN